jgi:hypothetical protein
MITVSRWSPFGGKGKTQVRAFKRKLGLKVFSYVSGFDVFLQLEVIRERLKTIRTIVGQADRQVNNFLKKKSIIFVERLVHLAQGFSTYKICRL